MPLWDTVGVRLFGSEAFDAPRTLCQQRAEEALGTEAYGIAFRQGLGLSAAEAVERARAARGNPAVGGEAEASAPRPFRTAGSAAVPGTRKPAGSPTGKGGEAAG